MGDPKGFLIVPVGFGPSGNIRAFTVDENGNLLVALSDLGGAAGMGEPKGKLVTPVAFDPDGNLKSLELDSSDYLLVSLMGGALNDILKSDGTKAVFDSLAAVLKAAILTTDGDLLYRDGAGNVTRLPVGADGEVLSVVGGVPAWAAAAGGYTEGAKVYSTTAKTIPDATDTVIDFDAEYYDTDGIHDNVTNNSRLTIQTAGKYFIWGNVELQKLVNDPYRLSIKKNGTTVIGRTQLFGMTTGTVCSLVFAEDDFAVGDYVELFVYHTYGDDRDTIVVIVTR